MRLYIVEIGLYTLTVIARNAAHAIALAVNALGVVPSYAVARPL